MKYTDDKIQQQIEAYLNQDMTDFERSKFEKLIHDDDELHDEVELQEATIEAIRNERMLALKAGLSQVNISLWSVTLIEAAKIAAIATSVGIVSIGGYYFYSNSQSIKTNSPISTEKSIVAPPSVNVSAEENSNQITNSVDEISASKGFDSKPEHASSPSINGRSEKLKSIGFNQEKSKLHLTTSPSENPRIVNDSELVEPNVKTINPSNAKDIALPEDGISNKSVLETVNPEVIIKKDNKDKFHYQFSDSKLILYADFSDKIYEILELNQDNHKSMFLAFQNKFYALDGSKMDITPLKEINDSQLVQILIAYQRRKN